MAKIKSKFVCQNCGYESAGYLGKCPECSSWASFVEEIDGTDSKSQILDLPDKNPPKKLSEIEMNTEIRNSSGISEFDRVLGGGIVQGSLTLIAGDPGIGKSTILLQTSGVLCNGGKKVLYVSAEESASQIKLRAERLDVKSDTLYIYPYGGAALGVILATTQFRAGHVDLTGCILIILLAADFFLPMRMLGQSAGG